MDTLLLIDTWLAVAVALYVAVLATRGVVPWVPTALAGIVAAFLVPVVGPLGIGGSAVWLHLRHRRAHHPADR